MIKYFLLLLIPVWLLAQPNITSVTFSTDSIQHGCVITINGSGFGTKSPAPPLIWDDCENRQINLVNEWGNAGWNESHPVSGVPDEWLVQYRDSSHRNFGAPSVHSTKIMVGGHWDNSDMCGSHASRDVFVSKYFSAASDVVFAMWDIKLDPLWAEPGSMGPDYNYKNWTIQTGFGGYNGSFMYDGIIGNYGPKADSTVECRWHLPIYNSAGTTSYGNVNQFDFPCKICDNGSQSQYRDDFASFLDDTDAMAGDGERFNENTDWTKMEFMYNRTIGLLYEKGYGPPEYSQRGGYSMYLDSLPNFRPGNAFGSVNSYTIGGYHRTALCTGGYLENDDDRRAFDNMYVDISCARIMLTDNSSYNASRLAEIAIPITWSNTQITATVNLGTLDNSYRNLTNVYCYVFNGSNVRSNAFTIELGEAIEPPIEPPAETIEVKQHRIGD